MLIQHPDPTVAHVLETWAPRMIVQGIDYNDLVTTAARIRVWDDWCREWCVTAAGHEELRYRPRLRAIGRAPLRPISSLPWLITLAATILPRIWSSMCRHIIKE